MKVLVTGGGGFLGTRIVTMLHERGDDVVALGRRRYPHIEALGVAAIQADLRDAVAIRDACAGLDAVIHAAAVPGIWGPRRMFQEINVGGTANVLDACRAHAVRRLVYTSTPSVVFGQGDLCGVDESCPYPARYLTDYPQTKAEAERMVLRANGPELAAVALRPHLIWGPGDPHLIPRVIARARAGNLRQVGDGTNLVDITYIDNAAAAHVQALDALAGNGRSEHAELFDQDHPPHNARLDAKVGSGSASPTCAGRTYFISQGEPVCLWSWLNELLTAVGVEPVRRCISLAAAYRLGAICESVYHLARVRAEPPMTRFLACQLAQSHYFDISAARRDLGYEPRVSTAEGLRRLIAWLRERAA